MTLNSLKPLIVGQFVGMTFINVLFFIDRMSRMGFYEALGRSVVAYSIGLMLIALCIIVAFGINAIIDSVRNRD